MKLLIFGRLMLALFAFFISFLIADFALVGAAPKLIEPLAGDFTNRQAAASVLGQADFTTNTAGSSASKFNRPESAGVHPVSKKVFIVEQNDTRVVRFTSAASLTSGAAAEAVFGQPDFATTTSGASQSKTSNPGEVSIESAGRLWVADSNNHRVLQFDGAATKADGANADAVLGQADFTTTTSGTTQGKLNFPQAVATEANNRLYVGDFSNSRVLIFNNAGNPANGALASVVLGQPNFTTGTANTGGVSAVSMHTPIGMSYDDTAGNLFVADYGHNRVLRFFAASPTAASVSLSGRVLVSGRRGLANAIVYLTDSEGNTRAARTTPFGYYHFEDIPAGQTVVITVVSKRFQFAPQVINLNEEVTKLNFLTEEKMKILREEPSN